MAKAWNQKKGGLKEVVGDFSDYLDSEMARKLCVFTRNRFQMGKIVWWSYFERKKAKQKKTLNEFVK